MPSDRATDIAVAGPYVVIYVLFAFLVVVAVLHQFLSFQVSDFVLVAIGLAVLYSLSVLYQGLFMIRYPATAVEVRMRPPLGSPWSRFEFFHERFTPDTNVGAILVGLMGVLTAIVCFAFMAVLATVVI